jgi:ADP-heptose:LPS heptosyltransferase
MEEDWLSIHPTLYGSPMKFTPIHLPFPPERLQILSTSAAKDFLHHGSPQIEWIRFEAVNSGSTHIMLADLLISNAGGLVPLLGLQSGDVSALPECLQEWPISFRTQLAETIRIHLSNTPQQHELRPVSDNPNPNKAVFHSAVPMPAIWDYASMLPRRARLEAIFDACQGNSCAVITADPWAPLLADRLNNQAALHFPEGLLRPFFTPHGVRCSNLAELGNDLDIVGCHDMFALSSNPDALLSTLASSLKPDGVLWLTVPHEERIIPNQEPPQVSHWNSARLEKIISEHFGDIDIFPLPSSLHSGNQESLLIRARVIRRKRRPRIVVHRSHAMGDVLWSTPIVRQLRRENPQATLVVSTRCTEVFRGNSDVDLLVSNDFQPDASDTVVELDHAYESKRSIHILDAYASVAGIVPTFPDPVFHPLTRDMESTRARILSTFPSGTTHLIVFHMAATSPDRIWPIAHWRELSELILESTNAGIVLVGSGKDYDADILPSTPRILNLVRQFDLSGTGACLFWCDVLVGPDSGLSHLAPAVGTPPIVLHNMASPSTRLPFKVPSHALWVNVACRGCLEQLPPASLAMCRYGKADCMDTISPKAIQDVLLSILGAVPDETWYRRSLAGRRDTPATLITELQPAPLRVVDHWIFSPLRTLLGMWRNLRNHSTWAARKDLRI